MAYSKIIFNGTTQIDLTQDTVVADKLYQSYTAHGADGLPIVGTATGGGEDRKDLCEPKDVDFIDFDGRLLYSYTAQEFLALSELPANPSYPGLTAQGWNWTLTDAQSFVSDYGALVIGQNYITDDGKTRIYITIPDNWIQTRESKTSNMALYLNKNESSNVFTIDWGDGITTPVTSSGTGAWNTTHKYQDSGDYIITIDVTVGSVRLGYWGSNQSLVSGEWAMGSCVNKVEIGANVVGLCRNAFFYMMNLKSVSIPNGCTNHDTGSDAGMFGSMSMLSGIVLPKNTAGQDTQIFGNATLSHIKYFSIPKTMTGFRWISSNSRNLRKMIFPNYNTSTTLQVNLYDCTSLTHFIVPGTYKTIPSDRCRSSQIKKLSIPSTVTSIAATAFSYNTYCEEVHLYPETPPTLANANAFNQIGSNLSSPTVFYVPYSADHSILEAYQTATNWSTYASRMQEEPQS